MSFKIVPMIKEEEISKRIAELGKTISKDYEGDNLYLLGILKGSIMFMTKLMENIDNEKMEIDFMSVSSYGNEFESSGDVRILKDIDESIEGKNVLIIEDIVDTGKTMQRLKEMLLARKPKSLKICTLLDKPSRRVVDIKPEYVGFTIENKFVAGFGLDLEQCYRQLPFVGEVVFEK